MEDLRELAREAAANDPVVVHGTPVYGVAVDNRTGCAHYRSALDIIALRFACCDRYYPCFECHEAVAGHAARVWPLTRSNEPAVLCGACGVQHTAREYLNLSEGCPRCGAGFNSGCKKHHHLYFEMICD